MKIAWKLDYPGVRPVLANFPVNYSGHYSTIFYLFIFLTDGRALRPGVTVRVQPGSIGAVEEPERALVVPLEHSGQFEFEIKCVLYFSGCLPFSTTPSLHKIDKPFVMSQWILIPASG